MNFNITDRHPLLHTETDDSFKKYRSFFRPAKYLIPAAVFALLLGSCDPTAPGGDDPADTDDGTDTGTTDDGTGDDTTVDPATVIGNPAFAAPVALNISWLSSGGNYSIFHPALADMDGDGDLDIVTGYKDAIANSSSPSYSIDKQGIIYLKNNTVDALNFIQDNSTFTGLPVENLYSFQGNAVGAMIPAVNDIDGDTDKDIVITKNFNENGEGIKRRTKIFIGKNTSNTFAFTTSSMGNYSSSIHLAPALADIDGDADMDLITGNARIYSSWTSSASGSSYNSGSDKKISYTANNGTGTFIGQPETSDLVAPAAITAVTDLPIPSFADIDNDGDQDMFTVNYNTGAVTFYLNTGTSAAPTFVAQTTAFGVIPSDGVKYFPAFGDMDGDTDLDVIVGTDDGRLLYIENTDID